MKPKEEAAAATRQERWRPEAGWGWKWVLMPFLSTVRCWYILKRELMGSADALDRGWQRQGAEDTTAMCPRPVPLGAPALILSANTLSTYCVPGSRSGTEVNEAGLAPGPA